MAIIKRSTKTIVGLESRLATIENSVVAETNRATGEEARIEGLVTAEVARAEGVEAGLQTALTQEISDRTAGDTALQSSIDAEVARASGIEAGLRTDVDDHETRVSSLESDTAKKAANLSDLTDIAAARSNLDVMSSQEIADAITTAELNLGSNISVADIAARDAIPAGDLSVGDNVFVADDGDSDNEVGFTWSIFKVTATTDGSGAGSTFVKIMDAMTLQRTQSAAAIKDAYESNADTNAFTDGDKAKVDVIGNVADAANMPSGGNIISSVNALEASAQSLQTQVDDEEAARIAADTALQTAINDEVANRTSSDAALQTAIDNEVSAREAADSALQTAITDAVSAGSVVFKTENLAISNDRIVLAQKPKDGMILNFGTVRHTDTQLQTYDITVVADATDADGKTYMLEVDAGILVMNDGDVVTVQYAHTPV